MNRNKIIILIIGILLFSVILISINNSKESYAVGTSIAEVVKNKSNGSSWSSGVSGVYYTNSHEYRYIGAEPNNYVTFGNDLYQIIGVFDSNSHGISDKLLVKLIRARILDGWSWGAYNTSNTSGIYADYKNDWTGGTTGVKSNLNILYNEFFYNKTDTSSTYGNCSDWTYYYIGDNAYKSNNCSKIVRYGINDDVRSYIQDDAVWYLHGAISSNTFSKADYYLCERGSYSCKGGNGIYNTSTTAPIGLLYPSDYMYASSYYSSDDTTSINYYYGINNWLYKGPELTITPSPSTDTTTWVIEQGGMSGGNGIYSNGSRPSFYLKSGVYVTGGDGSFNSPYTLGCDTCS